MPESRVISIGHHHLAAGPCPAHNPYFHSDGKELPRAKQQLDLDKARWATLDMKTSNQTLVEQLKITKLEIKRRKEYFNLAADDNATLVDLRNIVSNNIEDIVEAFYDRILSFTEMDRIIGDAETLRRLKNHQRNYILSLFDGQYDEDYVLS
ncbi:MAG: protoglobin domain-containing protein, partial [Thermodesulfobacteriota bacterium]|nr:protoglobin domain-containing protein [Thermodesulfobacteriota bacterium]